ncbi:MAG: cupin domain-containing protein [Thermoleophilia bacterium]|nr:cupin domain-containing protein [Thermoleophilia bacterium]
MELFNVFGDEWNDTVERPDGDTFKDAWVGARLGAELLGGSMYELPPHGKGWPYHFHHGNEELLVAVAGTPTVRTPEGERVLAAGDCVLFRRGPDGAHTFWNDADEPARVLMLSSLISPDVVTYPDSGKLSASSRFGGGRFFESSKVEYWEGEP